jgi:hypothetical protein
VRRERCLMVVASCVCRLVRQADEWGKRYNFWSCADVDIVLPKDYK